MKYKHIIWDWNGTLIDDAWLCVEIMNNILLKRGMNSITIDDYRENFTFPVRDYYIKLGFDFSVEPFEVCGMEFIHDFKKRKFDASLYTMIESVLDSLSKIGISHSILSAQNQNILDETIIHYQLQNRFEGVNGLDDHYAHSKVNLGQSWISALSYDPAEVVMIGDTVHDFEVAQAMETDCILMASGHNSRERLEETGVLVLDSPEEITRVLMT
ncbi:MAG: HAD family hydrolase [Candidatus Marinimicrobia bacterium]|jgi:phosphoglycolate phosphatase|nr:HAD family hydrolase [Candidatus Neomarinimicrobiota bacterium]MBT6870478.1 HAD family hydrolase [Candidatus Neomarinimicrobiota bacterium]|tara:strand:- start:917 stop:1558 length:642 start_codon:yes stop_codon:yes gene_type:complete